MPLLDVTDVLSDPDFATPGLICVRTSVVVGQDGFSVATPSQTPFSGVVTSNDGDMLQRGPDGSRVTGSITVHTTFRLSEGSDSQDADMVVWRGARFTVTGLNDYSHFGAGFVSATCTNVALGGS